MTKLEIDQPVKVVDYRGRMYDGRVVGMARVWVTIMVDRGGGYGSERRFRLDDQRDGRDLPHRFYTLDQWAEKERRDDAQSFLWGQGINLQSGSPWRGREETLADLIWRAIPGLVRTEVPE